MIEITKELKEEIVDIIDNVIYWDACPQDYKDRIEVIKQTLNMGDELNIFDTTQRLLNIKGLQYNDNIERSFINWLDEHNIWWKQIGSNLENITIYYKDYQTIKNTWVEVLLSEK